MSFHIRTLTLSTFTAMIVVAPACDDGADYEALGVTVQDLEAMSADELDALDAELVAHDPEFEPLDLNNRRAGIPRPHGPDWRLGGPKELINPIVFTHAELPQGRIELKAPMHPTHHGDHGEVPAGGADAFAADAGEPGGCDTHGEVVEAAAE